MSSTRPHLNIREQDTLKSLAGQNNFVLPLFLIPTLNWICGSRQLVLWYQLGKVIFSHEETKATEC